MKTLEEKLAKSLTAETTELIPYLPYLLQDLWELGSSPQDMIAMIQEHIPVTKDTQVLDLACGKGAVSVQIAKALQCRVKGIDIMPDFIDTAVHKALEYGVADLCTFEVGDINEAVKLEQAYDIVILGADGDVLGNPVETLNKLKNMIRSRGFLLIDDAYGREDSSSGYPTRDEWLVYFNKTGVKLINERYNQDEALALLNRQQQAFIVMRANALKVKFPEKAHLFDLYVKSQETECDELENEILGVTMLLQKE